MTIQMAYRRFLDIANRNATNNRVNVDKPRFVMLFNSIQNRYVEWVLEKRNEDAIRDIQQILVKDLTLASNGSEVEFTRYSLPENYFNFSNLFATAETDCCADRRMKMEEVKSEDVEELLVDTNNEPSFEFAESFYYFSEGDIILFKKNFEYSKVSLTYYRYPVQVDISGYKKIDLSASTDTDPEFDDKVVERILLAMEKEFSAINSETQEYQIAKDRLFTI